MIKQKNNELQYKLYKEEYDNVYFDIMEKGYDSSGHYSALVEEEIKKITGRKFVYLTSSGTAAITAGIYALDLFGKTVALSSYNFSACVNQYQVFCKTRFSDCDDQTLIDIDKIDNTCDALMLVNYWGNIVDYDKVNEKFKGKIIADCSQSFGGKYKGRNDGYFGHISTFAFGGQKAIGTRGNTGAVATDDENIAHRLNCAINQGRLNEDKSIPVEMVGFNGKPQELQAGLIFVNLQHREEWQKKRVAMANKMISELSTLDKIRIIQPGDYCEANPYKLILEVNDSKDLISFLRDNDVDCQVTYIDNWSEVWGDGTPMPVTDRLRKNTCSLPISPFFTDEHVDHIIKAVISYARTKCIE